MKTIHIVALVALALVITASVTFIVYKNWASIKNLSIRSKNAVKTKFQKITSRPIKKVTTNEIIVKAKEDPVMFAELAELNKEDLKAQKNAADIVQKTEQIVKQEASLKKSQATPITSTITLATKYRKIADEKEASAKYNDILKRIEAEKAKGAVLLSAVRAEQMKTEKLKIMDSLDMEDEYASNLKISSPISHVITKGDAEIFLKRHMGV